MRALKEAEARVVCGERKGKGCLRNDDDTGDGSSIGIREHVSMCTCAVKVKMCVRDGNGTCMATAKPHGGNTAVAGR